MICPQQGPEVVWVLVACELVQFPKQPTPAAAAAAAAAAAVVTALQHHIQLLIPAMKTLCFCIPSSFREKGYYKCATSASKRL
jgi:hypothetical protein